MFPFEDDIEYVVTFSVSRNTFVFKSCECDETAIWSDVFDRVSATIHIVM